MKIKYLGTSAAEGIPALFCECDTCKKSRSLGGKNIRTRSQAIVDDSLLLDFPTDTYSHFLTHNIPMSQIKSCLITHAHADHLCTNDIEYRTSGFAPVRGDHPLTFYADAAAHMIIDRVIEKNKISADAVCNVLVSPFSPFEASGYTVTALRASHSPMTTPVVYLIQKEGKAMLYSHDSSAYPTESIEYLSDLGKRGLHIDLVSSDCTEGTKAMNYIGHMNLQRNIEMRKQFDDLGITDKNTVWCLNHFSHNAGNGGTVIYDEFSSIAAAEGFVTSFDGLEIEF